MELWQQTDNNPLPAIVLALAATAILCLAYMAVVAYHQIPGKLLPLPANASGTALLAAPDNRTFRCELALTHSQRETGLMNRKSLCPQCCMLFVFDSPGLYGFWMKGTLIPLDIVYLDSNLTVVDSWLDAQPCTAGSSCPIYYPRTPATFVVEVNAGTALQSGMAAAGSSLQLSGWQGNT